MAKRYKVCAIIGDFENRKKGLTHYIFDNIDKSNFEIFYICYPVRDFHLWKELYNNSFHLFGYKTYLIPKYNLFKRITSVNRIMAKEKPDMIFSAVSGIEPFLLKKMRGIPEVDSIHGIPRNLNLREIFKGRPRESGVRAALVYRMKNLADSIIAVSDAVKLGLIENGVKKEKIILIHNGIDSEYIKQKSEEAVEEQIIFSQNKTILSVGRLSPEKGHKNLIEAFALIKNRTDAVLVIVGWGPEEPKMRELINKYGLDERVHMLGFRENPFKYMAKSSFLVLPSISEAFPSVLMEAAVCGLPVIATDSGGPREIIDVVKHGLVVPKQDNAQLASAMLKLTENDALLKTFSVNAQKNAGEFDIKKTGLQYQRLWLSCLGQDNS